MCPNCVARVSFAKGGEAAKAFFEELGCIVLNGVRCEVIRPPPPVSTVIAYWYPYEGLNSDNKTEIKKLGAHQSWPGMKVYTGSWVARMVRDKSIPRVSCSGSGDSSG